MSSATDSLGQQWGNPGLQDAGPQPPDARSQEYKDWHAKTFAPVRAQQREHVLDVVRGHLDTARTARQAGDHAGARQALARAASERRVAARFRAS